MSRLPIIKTTLTVIITLLLSNFSFSQEAEVQIIQSNKLEKALKERKKLLSKEELRTHYTIQVFAGDIEAAQKNLKECKQEFNEVKSQIHYETPYYKVWVGKFRNRLDADRTLLTIAEKYPDALVIKPRNKKVK